MKITKIHILLSTLVIFIFGCILHYQRGTYGTEIKSLAALGADDAYISYRYGWNLAHYGELSWNESGYRRVEGFSNPLWVYTSALWAVLNHKEWVYPLMVATSVILSSIVFAYLLKTVIRDNPDSIWSTTGVILAAAAPVIWLHNTSGLEGGVFGICLATLAYLSIFRNSGEDDQRIGIILLSGVLCLLRSDGFIYVGMILLSALIAGKGTWRWIILGSLPAISILFLWRWTNFGELLPNTALAKVNYSLLERFPTGISLFLAVLTMSALPIFILLYLVGLVNYARRILLAGIVLVFIWIAYYLYIGGDYLLDRHLVGIVILSGIISAPLWGKIRIPARVILISVFLVSIYLSSMLTVNRFNYLSPKGRDPWVMLGREMAKTRDQYGVFVTSIAGKIPFYAGGDCIDSWGLNDPYLATVRNEYFFPGHSAGDREEAVALALEHPLGFYTTFTGVDPAIISGPEDIALWVYTEYPQGEVQTIATQQDWEAALAEGSERTWSIITAPFIVNIYVDE